MPFDLRGFFVFVLELFSLAGDALSLNPRSADVAASIVGNRIAIAIIFLAGVSEGFGTQAAVLFVNQISRRNFYLNLLLGGFVFMLGAVGWIISIILVAATFFDVPADPEQALRVVSIGYFPLLFGFVGLAPYVGPGLLYILHAWSFIIVLMAVSAVLKLPLPEAFSCTIVGWVIVQLLRRVLTRPRAIVDRWLWTMTTGTAAPVGFDDMPVVLPVRQDGSAPAAERNV